MLSVGQCLSPQDLSNPKFTKCSFILNLAPPFALALAATVASRFASLLRAYLERYLTSRVYFRISIVLYLSAVLLGSLEMLTITGRGRLCYGVSSAISRFAEGAQENRPER